MFDDGFSGTKPRVNLSGSRTPANRDAFTANIQRQRAVREKEGQRNRAALLIQSFIKRHRLITTLKRAFRSSLDTDLVELLRTSISDDIQLLCIVVQRLVFILTTPASLIDFRVLMSDREPDLPTSRIEEKQREEPTWSQQSTYLIRNIGRPIISRSRPSEGTTSKVARQALDPSRSVTSIVRRHCVWLDADDCRRLCDVLKIIVHSSVTPPAEHRISWLKLLHIALCHGLESPGSSKDESLGTLSLSLLSRLIPLFPNPCSTLFVLLAGSNPLHAAPQTLRDSIASAILASLRDPSSIPQRNVLVNFISSGLWSEQLGPALERLYLSKSTECEENITKLRKEVSKMTSCATDCIPPESELQKCNIRTLLQLYSKLHSTDRYSSVAVCFNSFVLNFWCCETTPLLSPLSFLAILDVLMNASLPNDASRPSPLFANAIDALLRPESLNRMSAALSKATVPVALICLFRVVLPIRRHPWLEGSLIRVKGPDFFDVPSAQTFSEEEEEEESEPDEEDEGTFTENKPLQVYLQEIYAHPPETVLHSQIVLRHFTWDGKTIGLLLSYFSEKIRSVNSNSVSLPESVVERLLFCTSPGLQVLVPLLTSLAVLLEFRARQVVSDEETLLWGPNSDLQQDGLNFSCAIDLINRVAVTLVEVLYHCHRPVTLPITLGEADMELIRRTTPIMCRALRDLHRLRPSVLESDDWLVHTPILKPTAALLDHLESFLNVSSSRVSRRLVDSAVLPIPFAKKTLALLLTLLPHTLRLRDRNLLLQFLVMEDKAELFRDFNDPFSVRRGAMFRIRRNFIVEDTLASVHTSTRKVMSLNVIVSSCASVPSWKQRIQVIFMDEEGLEEMGIDGGGLFKEFLILLAQRLFSPDFGLFSELPDHSLVPNKQARSQHGPATTALFRLAGSVVGKALYECLTLEAVLNQSFIDLVQSRETQHLEDLDFLDPELFKQLQTLRNMEDVNELQLVFSVTIEVAEGRFEEVELIPGGNSIQVNESNRDFYIGKLTEFKLHRQFADEAALFRDGMAEVVPLQWLSGFGALELARLISGEETVELDVDDLASNVILSGGYDQESNSIKWLWNVLRGFSRQKQKDFLMFVTSCPRPPFLGFRLLQPRFTIHHIDSNSRLPSASTCSNQLNLPSYETQRELQEKLTRALEHAKGFHLG